jgi:hypothetical protein
MMGFGWIPAPTRVAVLLLGAYPPAPGRVRKNPRKQESGIYGGEGAARTAMDTFLFHPPVLFPQAPRGEPFRARASHTRQGTRGYARPSRLRCVRLGSPQERR